jgi:hypothetical protein
VPEPSLAEICFLISFIGGGCLLLLSSLFGNERSR